MGERCIPDKNEPERPIEYDPRGSYSIGLSGWKNMTLIVWKTIHMKPVFPMFGRSEAFLWVVNELKTVLHLVKV